MSILPRRIAAAFALLAVLLAVPQGAVVLCAGESGHLALEAPCADGPAGTHGHADPSRAAEPGHCECDDGCGTCRDAEVGIAFASTRARDHDSDRVLLEGPAPAVSPLPGPAPVPPGPARSFAAAARVVPVAAARVRSGVQLRL